MTTTSHRRSWTTCSCDLIRTGMEGFHTQSSCKNCRRSRTRSFAEDIQLMVVELMNLYQIRSRNDMLRSSSISVLLGCELIISNTTKLSENNRRNRYNLRSILHRVVSSGNLVLRWIDSREFQRSSSATLRHEQRAPSSDHHRFLQPPQSGSLSLHHPILHHLAHHPPHLQPLG